MHVFGPARTPQFSCRPRASNRLHQSRGILTGPADQRADPWAANLCARERQCGNDADSDRQRPQIGKTARRCTASRNTDAGERQTRQLAHRVSGCSTRFRCWPAARTASPPQAPSGSAVKFHVTIRSHGNWSASGHRSQHRFSSIGAPVTAV